MFVKERILIVRYGEVSLKGMNKPWFERVLEGRVRKALAGAGGGGKLHIARRDGLMVVTSPDGRFDGCDEGDLIRRISRVFGVASVSPAMRIESRAIEDIAAASVEYAKDSLARRAADGSGGGQVTFKVYAKRSDKAYPLTSPELAAKVGEAVLEALGPAVKVDVKKPDIPLNVHLRRKEVFIYDEKHDGFGGLPLGTNGRGVILLSGGIDSPVAAWLMAKRGMGLVALHYHSYPYTSGRAREKVMELASILAEYCGGFRMHIVNLLPAQEAIAEHCPEGLMTIMTRRFMMRVAERVAREEGCSMLITGESLGQVASQTAESIFVTDAATELPVMRPLIALDKTDIMDLAREIGTYEKSIEPYEDCCTVFLPKHPVTRPKLDDVLSAENVIPDAEGLIDALTGSKEVVEVTTDGREYGQVLDFSAGK